MIKAELTIDRLLSLRYGVLGRLSISRVGGASTPAMRSALGEMWSIERGWHGNAPCVSCIPTGSYPLKRETQGRNMAKFRQRWGHEWLPELEDVEGRSQIQIHPGSSTVDSLGCVLPVRLPRIGIPKPLAKIRHSHFHRSEIERRGGMDDFVRTIAGSGQSREAYCALFDALNKFNVQSVVVRGVTEEVF